MDSGGSLPHHRRIACRGQQRHLRVFFGRLSRDRLDLPIRPGCEQLVNVGERSNCLLRCGDSLCLEHQQGLRVRRLQWQRP